MTAREIEKIILEDGWFYIGCNGSHKHYKHPVKKGIVTIPWHNGDLKKGTLKSILKQAQIKLK